MEVLRTKDCTAGRTKGGFYMFWRKDLGIEAIVISDYIVLLNFEFKGRKTLLYYVYFPPYQYFDNNCSDFFDLIEKDLYGGKNVKVMRDLNCHMGEENTYDQNRYSKDKTINKRGRIILEAVRTLGLQIGNGTCEGDKNGEVTFTHRNGKSQSVVDYLLFNSDVGTNFKVLNLTHFDPFPILATHGESHDVIPMDVPSKKYLQCYSSDLQRLTFQMDWENNLSQLNIYSSEIQELDAILKSSALQATETAQIFKLHSNKRKIKGPNWFDKQCQEAKTEKIKN